MFLTIGLVSGCGSDSVNNGSTIQVTTINPIGEDNTLEVEYGTSLSNALPNTVKVTLSNNNTANVPVEWNNGEPVYDKNTADTYTFIGKLDLKETNYSNPDDIIITIELVVKPDPNPKPEIKLEKTITDLEVKLTGSVTDAEATIEEVNIDWGDGTKDIITNGFNNIEKTHIYNSGDNYTIKITAKNSINEYSNENLNIIVKGFAGGDGTKENPYLIENAVQLSYIREHLDSYFKQTAQIDLSNYDNWKPIGIWYGEGYSENQSFSGIYDGNGYVIKNLNLSLPNEEKVGIFKFIDAGGVLKNINIQNFVIEGKKNVGSLVGILYDGDIVNCKTDGLIKGETNVGGIIGTSMGNATIQNSYSNSDVEGFSNIGGVIGYNEKGKLSDSYSTGVIDGTTNIGGVIGKIRGTWDQIEIKNSYSSSNVFGNNNVGGLIGSNVTFGDVKYCFSNGVVDGGNNVGGLIGYNWNAVTISESYSESTVYGEINVGGLVGENIGEIINCYSTGTTEGVEKVGGLVGNNPTVNSEIKNSYATGKVVGDLALGGLVGVNIDGYVIDSYYDQETTNQSDINKGIPKSTSEMMQKTTFESNWDFISIWDIEEGNSYPFLQQNN